MTKPTILVTGVGGRSVGHQILSALACVPDRYRVLAADADPFSFGLYIGHRPLLVPVASDPAYLDSLARLVHEHGVRAILPGTEPEVRVLAAHAEIFHKLGCQVVASPPRVVQISSDKGVMDTWLSEHGFATPRTLPLERWGELVAQVGYPLIGKPGRESGGSRGVALLCDEQEVLQYVQLAPAGSLVQEYVPSDKDEYTVGVLLEPAGSRVIDSIVLR